MTSIDSSTDSPLLTSQFLNSELLQAPSGGSNQEETETGSAFSSCDSEKASPKEQLTVRLPNRNSQANAAEAKMCLLALAGLWLTGFVIFCVVCLCDFAMLSRFMFVTYAAVCIASVPFAVFAYRVLTNQSRHEISIRDGVVQRREKLFVVDYTKQCPVSSVKAIRVLRLGNCPTYQLSAEGEKTVKRYLLPGADRNWGLLAFEGESSELQPATGGKRTVLMYAAPGYPLEYLVKLANEIAVEMELARDSVVISDATFDPFG